MQKYEKYLSFLSENFQFFGIKFSIYLNRRVFVMRLRRAVSYKSALFDSLTFSLSALHIKSFPTDSLMKEKKKTKKKTDNKCSLKFDTERVKIAGAYLSMPVVGAIVVLFVVILCSGFRSPWSPLFCSSRCL